MAEAENRFRKTRIAMDARRWLPLCIIHVVQCYQYWGLGESQSCLAWPAGINQISVETQASARACDRVQTEKGIGGIYPAACDVVYDEKKTETWVCLLNQLPLSVVSDGSRSMSELFISSERVAFNGKGVSVEIVHCDSPCSIGGLAR